MKIKLLTNFHDYYDHHFDIDGMVFDRRDSIGLSRPEIFQYFESLNVPCVNNGLVKDVYNAMKYHYKDKTDIMEFLKPEVVVYLNDNSHQGKDKIKIDIEEAADQYPDYYCSEYIPSSVNEDVSCSHRLLGIGGHYFWMRYDNTGSWKSNVGENVEITLLYQYTGGSLEIHYPLFAIDFIRCNGFLAMDFNQSPKIEGTGIEGLLSGKKVRELIERKIKS